MNKILVCGGLCITALGLTAIILFVYGVESKQFDKVTKPEIYGIIALWVIGCALLLTQGSSIVQDGLYYTKEADGQ